MEGTALPTTGPAASSELQAASPSPSPSPKPQSASRKPAGAKGGRKKRGRDGESRGPSLASQDKSSVVLGEAAFGRRISGMNRPFRNWSKPEALPPPLPSVEKGVLRVVRLGGEEEIGKVMTVIEYEGDALIVDAGLHWPERQVHGIDYSIPDASYLHGRTDKLRAILLTNGAPDYAGAVPHLVPSLGAKLPVYATPMTAALIQEQQRSFSEQLNVQLLPTQGTLKLGAFEVEPIHVNSSLPGTVAYAITCPAGTIVITGPCKIDNAAELEPPTDLVALRRIGDRGVLALFADAVAAGSEGYQFPESAQRKQLEPIFTEATGRIIVAMSSALIWRAQHILTLAARTGRVVSIEHAGLRSAVDIAVRLGAFPLPPGVLVDHEEAARRDPKTVVAVTTGLHGEHECGLTQVVAGTHPTLRFLPGDTVVFGPSTSAANGRVVEQLMDAIYREGGHVISLGSLDLHTAGHMKAEELKVLLQLVRPLTFLGCNGTHTQHVLASQTARQVGFEPEVSSFVLYDGQAIEFRAGGARTVRKERASNIVVAVDGLGVGDVGDSVMKDREAMATDGVFLLLLRMNRQGGTVGPPEVLTHGFVQAADAGQLLAAISAFVLKVSAANVALAKDDQKEFKFLLQREVEKFLFQKTEREPMVIPLLVGA